MESVNVDLINNGQAQGAVAQYLQSKGSLNINKMRPFLNKKGVPVIAVFTGGDAKDPKNYKQIQVNDAVLNRDEWKQLDDAVMQVTRERLTGMDYFISKGLVKNLPNAMGTTVLEWRSQSDSQEAIMSMDAVSRGTGDRSIFKNHYLPIPIIHADYEINERYLQVARNSGNGVDTNEAEHAVRRILEKQEDMLFTNTSYSWGDKANDRNTIYSLLNYPDRNQVTLSEAWNASGKTPAEILADVVSMKNASIAKKKYGPWTLFIPTNYDAILDEDYSVSGASVMTIRQRILMLDGVTEIKVVDRLPNNNVLLVEMKSDTIRIINGLPIQNVQWSTEGGMVHKYKVMTIRVPQIRSDYDGNNGIVHLA